METTIGQIETAQFDPVDFRGWHEHWPGAGTGVIDLGVVQSTRGYQPKAVSHYTATWVPRDEFETMNPPSWPLKGDQGEIWDREHLKREYIEKYKPLTDRNVQVHVGEWSCFNKTPHVVALAWMSDCLSLWKEAGWGFTLWNLRGAFGVLDSKRVDVQYEDYKGHELDRKMLELLRSHLRSGDASFLRRGDCGRDDCFLGAWSVSAAIASAGASAER